MIDVGASSSTTASGSSPTNTTTLSESSRAAWRGLRRASVSSTTPTNLETYISRVTRALTVTQGIPAGGWVGRIRSAYDIGIRFVEDNGETLVEMPVDVTVQNPWSWVVGREAEDGTAVSIQCSVVNGDRLERVRKRFR